VVKSLQNSVSARYATQKLVSADAKHEHQYSTIRFSVWDSSKTLEVALNKDVFIGRSTAEKSVDVDLNPFNAHVLGVSRLHAMIKTFANTCVLIDLGSTNGTRINGKSLAPRQAYLLKTGDEIKIGGVYLQISLY
jgi:pSer/pThr/pTyr-binding forkhead associated (FHA) protein